MACLAQAAMAVPAHPHRKTVQQADGSYITVTLHGDEHGHIVLADDGQPLCFNSATGNYEYAVLNHGIVAASGIKAQDAAERSVQDAAFLKTLNVQDIMSAYMRQRTDAAAKVAEARRARIQARKVSRGASSAVSVTDMRINDFPSIGQQHSLVILAQFADCPFSTVGDDPHAYYTDMLNKEGFTHSNGAEGSARDYFVASSYGKFQPTFDVVGPVTLSKSVKYYGENGSGRDNAQRLMEFVQEACTLADPMVDFSQYDKDGDGLVDNVFIYFAGYGEADSGKGYTIWPHAADYRDVCKDAGQSSSILKLDGMQIASYTCSNEINGQTQYAQPTGIGTFVHEFGHVLGLADHYDTGATSLGEAFHPGAYDVMASGSYNNNGNTPPSYSAFERATLGWMSLSELAVSSRSLNSLECLNDKDDAYRVTVSGTMGKEFFVLENRQQSGWDKYIPGHGMLIWHIDYDSGAWNKNEVNITNSHQRVDIVEADGIRSDLTRNGDTYPGASGVTSCKLSSWNSETALAIDDIEEKDGQINVLLAGLGISMEAPQPVVGEVTDHSASLSWAAAGIANRYSLNLYKVAEGKKTPVAGYTGKTYDEPGSINIEGLQPETEYIVAMSARRGSYISAETTVSFTTTAIPFGKLSPANLKTELATSSSIEATWDAVERADDYEVTLSRLSYSADAEGRGYDFSDQLSGMPPLWETNAGFINQTYGESAPSLRMNKDGNYLIAGYDDSMISGIRFWAKASSSADGSILVQVLNDGDWKTVKTFAADDEMLEGTIYECQFGQTKSARLLLEREAGTFYVDDVITDCHSMVATPLAEYDRVSTGGKTSFTFTGLEGKAGSYMISVRAKNGSETSETVSVQVSLAGSTGIGSTAPEASEANATYYSISGARINGTPTQKGIYIIRRGTRTEKRYK